jgi:lipopolysaccharide cholinephosphotransferase
MSISQKENFDVMFPDIRETGETNLRQCQLVMLRMLKIFDYLCAKHNIEYFLTGGSLLGAIRHKGFIPWDDDIDIGMKRKEYEKFIKLAAPELPKDIFFQNTSTDPYFPLYATIEGKLRDKYSRHIRSENFLSRFKWHDGICMDLFVYDRAFLPHNASLFYQNYFFKKFFRRFRNKNIRASVLQAIEKWSPFTLVYASSYLNEKKMIKAGGAFKTEQELSNLVRVPFEDMQALAPEGWHTYLQRMYGDYMKLPPLDKQQGHHGSADPFTPCQHKEILYWQNRHQFQKS